MLVAARRQPMQGSYLQWLGILALDHDPETGTELVLEAKNLLQLALVWTNL